MTVSPTPPQDDVKSMVYSGEDAFVPAVDDTPSLRQLAEAATPGPWSPADWNDDFGDTLWTVEASEPEVLGAGQSSIWPDGIRKKRVADTDAGDNPTDDAAYIAAANPRAILELLDEVDALRAAGLILLALVDETDAYQKRPESGDWGVECACCMGELFQDDRASIETARQALKGRV